MSIATTRFVTGADRFAALHTTALPQVDELCGCFQAHLALRLAGFDVDQEDVALKAGSTQSPSRYKGGLPAGETGRDARCEFPITDEVRFYAPGPLGTGQTSLHLDMPLPAAKGSFVVLDGSTFVTFSDETAVPAQATFTNPAGSSTVIVVDFVHNYALEPASFTLTGLTSP